MKCVLCFVNCVSCCRWRMRTFVEIVLEVVVSVICCGEGFIFSQRAGTRYHHPTAEYHAVKAHRLPPLNLTRCTSCVRCDSKTTSRSATGGILIASYDPFGHSRNAPPLLS